jgi:hypothetical protein
VGLLAAGDVLGEVGQAGPGGGLTTGSHVDGEGRRDDLTVRGPLHDNGQAEWQLGPTTVNV